MDPYGCEPAPKRCYPGEALPGFERALTPLSRNGGSCGSSTAGIYQQLQQPATPSSLPLPSPFRASQGSLGQADSETSVIAVPAPAPVAAAAAPIHYTTAAAGPVQTVVPISNASGSVQPVRPILMPVSTPVYLVGPMSNTNVPCSAVPCYQPPTYQPVYPSMSSYAQPSTNPIIIVQASPSANHAVAAAV